MNALDPVSSPRQATTDETTLPQFPRPNRRGLYPGLQYIRTSIARDIIQEGQARGLTQQELAALAWLRKPFAGSNRASIRPRCAPSRRLTGRVRCVPLSRLGDSTAVRLHLPHEFLPLNYSPFSFVISRSFAKNARLRGLLICQLTGMLW